MFTLSSFYLNVLLLFYALLLRDSIEVIKPYAILKLNLRRFQLVYYLESWVYDHLLLTQTMFY